MNLLYCNDTFHVYKRHDQAHFILPSVSNQKDFNQFERKNFGTFDCSCSYLVCIHLAPDELWPPELQSLFQREADAFEEEAVLHATPVPQVVVLPQALVELPHAEWERFPRELMDDEQQREVRTVRSSLISVTVLEILNSRFFLFLS